VCAHTLWKYDGVSRVVCVCVHYGSGMVCVCVCVCVFVAIGEQQLKRMQSEAASKATCVMSSKLKCNY